MSMNKKEFISLADLGMAYRKAKVDLFYSPRSCRNELAAFESNLLDELKVIQKGLDNNLTPYTPKASWTLAPKGIDVEELDLDTNVISSDPEQSWKDIHEQANENSHEVNVEFRLMEKLSIAFHVFSALWINKVGHKFEKKLSESVCGNRLRRGKSEEINPFSLGSTMPYLHAYRKWRDDAFDAIEQALEQDKPVIAVTADVNSFYHKLDVRFMLNSSFIKKIGVSLDPDEWKLHELFINSLHEWAENTPLKRGLPVGLTASSLIANVALFELDKLFEEEVAPLYYGRYVDDIILVMENRAKLKTSIKVWDWLIKRMDGALEWKISDGKENEELSYNRDYLEGSSILFSNRKNKTFLLSNVSGLALLKSFRYEVQSRTSEWRALPDLPSEPNQLESAFVSIIQRDGAPADSLRKADKVSAQRAGFALKLRDVEAYSRALPAVAWQPQRHEFLDAFIRHILVLPVFFDFFNYLPRVISLAVSCADFSQLWQILDALNKILKQLDDCNFNFKIAGNDRNRKQKVLLKNFKNNLNVLISEAVETAYPLHLSKESKLLWQVTYAEPHAIYNPGIIPKLQANHRRYICADLAYRPLKQYLLSPALSGVTQHPIAKKDLLTGELTSLSQLLELSIIPGCEIVAKLAKLPNPQPPEPRKVPTGLLFPVRPLGIHDLYILHPDPFSDKGVENLKLVLLAMRGFKPEKGLPSRKGKSLSPIEVIYERDIDKAIRIAVTSWKTERDSWIASASQSPDPDTHRLNRLYRLLNQILECGKKLDYLILPELSIPAHWFWYVARKFQDKGVSLICGIEYLHSRRRKVHNQIWAALSHDALGFPATMIYMQDKQRPALHEEQELMSVSGKTLKPLFKPWSAPTVINHGEFQFALLICSELTNVAYRTALRGKVDALFVPEWNKDTETFSTLVESTALDIHAYIIQCNNRQYGDSRIRSPHKNNWERDIIRVKGGIVDYFVIGEINIRELRKFQSFYRSPSGTFKPVPDGFKIAHSRKA